MAIPTPTRPSVGDIKISPEEVKERLAANEPLTILDVRGPSAWEQSDEKIVGAIRVDPHTFRADPAWPKDRLTVLY
jgi:rhodanese-related sulfurtransferase